MPLELRLDTADVLGLRFARSPLWETMEALRTLLEPQRQAYHLSWLRVVDRAAVAAAVDVLRPLVPRPGEQPDFLMPIPAGPITTADDDLAAVAATPLDVIEHELHRAARAPRASAEVRAGVAALLADPAAALARIVDAQRACWMHLVRPFWSEIDDLLAADIAHRAAVLAEAGLAAVLNGLNPQVSWSDGVLHVASSHHGLTADVAGRGLVVMPSVFGWPTPVALTDLPWQPTIVYPARGVGTLWPPDPRRDPGALGDLLGASRAAPADRTRRRSLDESARPPARPGPPDDLGAPARAARGRSGREPQGRSRGPAPPHGARCGPPGTSLTGHEEIDRS
jgi:Family of unknown function (DUF5937)